MSPTLRLYNTLTRTKEDFVPVDPQNLRMYVCGPTVYDYAHIGNARPVIVFDVLYRLLKHLAKQGIWDGGKGETKVTYARNLTDVDDKINARAARDWPGLPLNEAIAKVTEGTTAQFHADIDALGCLRPDEEPRATDHIEEMKAIIERLIARGVAYVAEEHVLFHVPAVAHLKAAPKYGSLARRSLDEMMAGARVDVAPYKKDPMDFVLWKPSRDGIDPGWPSPAGIATPGRPGWHIECSAMSMAKLLEPFGGGLSCDDPQKNVFDIHGGGIDLVFPHHENEIAQSCCAFGAEAGIGRMANYWMHNGFLQVEGEKMSKSLGNFVTINELLETESFGGQKWHGRVLRLAMLMTQYRQPIDWTVDRLVEARSNLFEWNELCFEAPAHDGEVAEVVQPLLDDLNTAAAIAGFHALAKAVRAEMNGPRKVVAAARLREALFLFGLYHDGVPAELLKQDVRDRELDRKVDSLVTARLAARRAKNFAESDRIRDELAAMGIALKDGKDPATGEPTTTWEVKR
ncbi:cysteine--tRNA ligase [Bosea sp. 124]|uniref:cysteine--tRNA ligase n=1 Tax=Bosea sp. 124 TaxID=2135642 RepID=UPI000D3C531D|nr:cysteine--tRNA ligase [Bosea sp. 124]PTM38606.1 cysteinyl-tRNA synthetase [Bosea sp. 124]